MHPLGSRRYDNHWNTCSAHADPDVLRSEEARVLDEAGGEDPMRPGAPLPISGVGLLLYGWNESIRTKFSFALGGNSLPVRPQLGPNVNSLHA